MDNLNVLSITKKSAKTVTFWIHCPSLQKVCPIIDKHPQMVGNLQLNKVTTIQAKIVNVD